MGTDTRSQTVCFTGHREIPAGIRPAVQDRLKQTICELIDKGYRYFGAGGARGFDAMAAEAVLELKQRHPHIHLILVLPFRDQYQHERGWSKSEVEQYHDLQQKASKVRILTERYSSGVYYRRNRHLVDFSSVCVAYCTRQNSGTSYTVNYATSKGVQVINISE